MKLKKHLMLKGKALCGRKRQKRRLEFVTHKDEVTCGNCLRAIER